MRHIIKYTSLNENNIKLQQIPKFEQGKRIGIYPEYWEDIKDFLTLYKEGHPKDVSSYDIEFGYITPNQISSMYTTQGVSITSKRKMKELFPSGDIPDKWKLAAKMMIKYNPIESTWVSTEKADWASIRIWNSSNLDELAERIKSIKVLMLRLEKWCDVYVSPIGGFEGGRTGQSICVLAIVKD